MTPSDVGLRTYFQRLENCKKPLPIESKDLINELGLRVVSMLPYHNVGEVGSADGVLRVTFDENSVSALKVLENNTSIFEFGISGKVWSQVLKGKEEIVIKTLKMVMCRVFANKRGLHLYYPAYPEPEIMTVTEVEGGLTPRRYINEAWINWMKDSGRFNHLTQVVALRVIMNRLFPEGHDGKVARMVVPIKGESLEFEIIEVKRI